MTESIAKAIGPLRRVAGQLTINEIVSVQPMSMPSGLIHFLDYQYGGPPHIEQMEFGFYCSDRPGIGTDRTIIE